MLKTYEGGCHCGRVRFRVSGDLARVVECNCSLCAKTGWLGVYFSSDELTITGELDRYTRSDMATAWLTVFRCAHCGIATHWEPLTPSPSQ